MTLEQFFQLFPISQKGIAKMLGLEPKWFYNRLYRQSDLSDDDVKMLNECVQELSYQLSKTFISGNSRIPAICHRCYKDFSALVEGDNAIFYDQNGMICDKCRKTMAQSGGMTKPWLKIS